MSIVNEIHDPPFSLRHLVNNIADSNICKLCLRLHTTGGSHYTWALLIVFNILLKGSHYYFVTVMVSLLL